MTDQEPERGPDVHFDDVAGPAGAPLSPQTLAALGVRPMPRVRSAHDAPGESFADRAERSADHAHQPADPPTGSFPAVDTGGQGRVRRKVTRLGRRWRRSLSLRVTTLTVAVLTLAFALLMAGVTWQIRDAFFDERIQEIRTDAAYRTSRAQEAFDASTATTTQEIQRVAAGAVEQQVIGTTAGPVGASIMRAPGQPASTFSEPTTSVALRDLVTSQMRQAVEGPQQYWQSVAIPQTDGGSMPGIVVGQTVNLPSAGRYQYYLFYSLAAEEETIEMILRVLTVAVSVFIVVVASIVWGVVRGVLRPVRQAALSAERLADGLLDERMEVKGHDEIARLARSFNEMAASLQHQIERLGALSVLQQRFVSDVSHELRTPLTTVKMAADMIYDGRDEFPPQLRRSAELLQNQIDRFDAMLADLLEISRIDAGAAVLDLADLDLGEIVVRVVDMAQMLAEDKGTTIEIEQSGRPVMAECDGRRIERIIRNLVVNAVEHSEGRPVVVTLASSSDASAVRVRDHGVGMTEAEALRVFDRFWRADPARARTTGGTGLGLTISLEDARLHGGTLTATGRPNEGAAFLLTLPHTAGATISDPPLDLGELALPPALPPAPLDQGPEHGNTATHAAGAGTAAKNPAAENTGAVTSGAENTGAGNSAAENSGAGNSAAENTGAGTDAPAPAGTNGAASETAASHVAHTDPPAVGEEWGERRGTSRGPATDEPGSPLPRHGLGAGAGTEKASGPARPPVPPVSGEDGMDEAATMTGDPA